MKKVKKILNNSQSLIEVGKSLIEGGKDLIEDGKDILTGFISDSRESVVKVLEENHPNLYIIENGWVDYLELAQDNLSYSINSKKLFRNCDTEKKSYHGDATLDLILGVNSNAIDLKAEREAKLKDFKYNIHLINIYENSYITGEPKVEKQASLESVYQKANDGDILLMNMELYRPPYNLPITADPISLEIVKKLKAKGVICVFPAGNSCIDLDEIIDNPEGTYSIVGAKTGDIYTSNFTTNTECKMTYVNLDEKCKDYFGLNQSSAAAALFVKNYLIPKNNPQIDNINPKKEELEKLKTTNYKNLSFGITNKMLEKWKNELSVTYDKVNTDDTKIIENIAKQLNPINRNLFPYPIKLKVDNNKINFIRSLDKDVLELMVSKFKEQYLALKLCFGINANGDILVLASGYIPEGIDISQEIKLVKEDKMEFFNVSNEAYFLNFENNNDNSKILTPEQKLELIKVTLAQKKFYISEFQRHLKKTETYGLTIGLNLLESLLSIYYKGEKLQLMIVSDSRNMDSEQEFGILLTNGSGQKPICIIKDRVINQADGPTCPPVPPCNE